MSTQPYDEVELQLRARAADALVADDPYAYCIAHFTERYLDREGRTIRFVFADKSELTFNIKYEVARP